MEKWREGGEGGWGEQEGKQLEKERGKKKAFNLFTITMLCWFQQNGLCAEYFSFSQGPAFVHRAVRVAGSQQTLIALRPQPATFKQGHSSSHGKGNGLWPRSLITPLPQCTRSSGKPCDKQTYAQTCMHAYGQRSKKAWEGCRESGHMMRDR